MASWPRHPSSINIFKRHLWWSYEADSYQISHIASIGGVGLGDGGGGGGQGKGGEGRQIMAFLSQSEKNSGFYGNLRLPLTYNGEKWKMAFIAISLQVFWQKVYRNIPWVVIYQTYHFCPNIWIWLVAMAIKMPNLWNDLLLRSHKEDKAETLQKC